MMNDGHSGIENRNVNEGSSGTFRLVMSYLKHGTGQGTFVIHATSNSYPGVEQAKFMSEIGFHQYDGECPFFHEKCYYREIALHGREAPGIEHTFAVQRIHEAFGRFAENFDQLFQLRQERNRLLASLGFDASKNVLFGPPVEIRIEEGATPLWIEEVKLPQLRELEARRDALQGEINELSGLLPLVYSTGRVLEEAVVRALEFLGLEAELTEPGFTADVLARTIDGSRRFGIEVTGTTGGIRKANTSIHGHTCLV